MHVAPLQWDAPLQTSLPGGWLCCMWCCSLWVLQFILMNDRWSSQSMAIMPESRERGEKNNGSISDTVSQFQFAPWSTAPRQWQTCAQRVAPTWRILNNLRVFNRERSNQYCKPDLFKIFSDLGFPTTSFSNEVNIINNISINKNNNQNTGRNSEEEGLNEILRC